MENNEQQKTDNVQCVSEIQKNTGESNATASFVLGLVGLLLGFSVIVPLILGIIGVIQANKAKERGCNNSSSTAGFVLSLISVILGGIAIVVIFLLFSSMFTLAALSV
ncbi:MAG: hypothetical protein SPJ08_01150 [Sphaerochaetaceae bacterium]|nr:hypothetical protein [Sphaerochaetaceae bacterium]